MKYFIFSTNDDIAGEVIISLSDSAFDHNGITIELIGQICNFTLLNNHYK